MTGTGSAFNARSARLGEWFALYGLSVLLALVLSAILVEATSGSWRPVVDALLDGSVRGPGRWGETLGAAGPLLLVALGTIISGRAGLVNIGQEGQLFVGEFLAQRRGLGPLDGEQRVFVADVLHLGVELVVLDDPGKVAVLIGGVDAEEEAVVGEPVNEQVVDEAAALVEQTRVLRLAVLEARGAVRSGLLDEVERLGADDFELPHVADVEQTNALADGFMLGDEAGVLDRHVPAAEVDHTRPEGAVNLVERGSEEVLRCGGGSH